MSLKSSRNSTSSLRKNSSLLVGLCFMHFSHRLSHKDQASLALQELEPFIHKAENVHFGATAWERRVFSLPPDSRICPSVITGCSPSLDALTLHCMHMHTHTHTHVHTCSHSGHPKGQHLAWFGHLEKAERGKTVHILTSESSLQANRSKGRWRTSPLGPGCRFVQWSGGSGMCQRPVGQSLTLSLSPFSFQVTCL